MKLVSSVYFAQCGDRIKIGLSSQVPERLSQLRTGAGAPVALIASVEGDASVERALHRKLRKHRLDGEWFADCPDVRAAIRNSIVNFPPGNDAEKKARRANSKFAAVCKIVWPEKTADCLAEVSGSDVRTAWRWLSGESHPPGIVLAAIMTEITRRD
jgi:hypothetical protein